MTDTGRQPATRLARRLGTGDAVIIGLGSMIGAGVFAALGPAAAAAGAGLLIGLAIAALVAYCNATSSAQLAALYPASGGTYVYGPYRSPSRSRSACMQPSPWLPSWQLGRTHWLRPTLP